jgi:predicted esterase YcpF (UPF0227 family)
MGIFAKPAEVQTENEFGLKVLFLHGLESSPSGDKARFLQSRWGALCPLLRTEQLIQLKRDCNGVWSSLEQDKLDEAFAIPYQDARDAIRYAEPDVIVGSSMGGAILFKLIEEGHFSGTAVFCAPGITNLLPQELINKKAHEALRNSVWLLGETDTVVSNRDNIRIAKRSGGSVIISPKDDHRLNKSLTTDILESAVLTAIELSLE